MDNRYPTGTDEEREKAVSIAALSIQRGELIAIPTDTVYGLAADAFDAEAVADLLEAKGRGRQMPPPVLVSSPTTLDALAAGVPQYARALVEAFWPGPLTLVVKQQASLQWDLGDTRGTVAVRMPDHDLARELLERTGPLAVSSANLTGQPAATDADQVEEMLGEEVAAIIDDGPSPGGQASTIVDATGPTPRILREGALSLADLDRVLRPLGLGLPGVTPAATDGSEDPPREHAEEPAEGADEGEGATAGPEVPREHAEEPAEGPDTTDTTDTTDSTAAPDTTGPARPAARARGRITPTRRPGA